MLVQLGRCGALSSTPSRPSRATSRGPTRPSDTGRLGEHPWGATGSRDDAGGRIRRPSVPGGSPEGPPWPRSSSYRLDAPCGQGRISNVLAAEGFKVTGVDRTPLFLNGARYEADQLGVEVDYHQGDLRALPVSGPFDAVLCWFTSFGYFDDDDNRLVLQQFVDVLGPGETLLVEAMHHDGFVRDFTGAAAATATERGDDLMIEVTTFDSVVGRIETERTVRRGEDVRRSHHSVRLPTVLEFDEWLRMAGFSARKFNDRGGRQLRFDTWRLVIVATR